MLNKKNLSLYIFAECKILFRADIQVTNLNLLSWLVTGAQTDTQLLSGRRGIRSAEAIISGVLYFTDIVTNLMCIIFALMMVSARCIIPSAKVLFNA